VHVAWVGLARSTWQLIRKASLRLSAQTNFCHVCWNLVTCISVSLILLSLKGKGKIYPRTVHEGPEGDLRYSSTLSLTLELDGVGGQRHAPATLPSGKTRYPLHRRLGGPQRRSGRVWKFSSSLGFDPQPVASRYTDWAIPAHILLKQSLLNYAFLSVEFSWLRMKQKDGTEGKWLGIWKKAIVACFMGVTWNSPGNNE